LGHEINKGLVSYIGTTASGDCNLVGVHLYGKYIISTESPRSFFTSRNKTGRFHVPRCVFALLWMVVVNQCSELGKVEGIKVFAMAEAYFGSTCYSIALKFHA